MSDHFWTVAIIAFVFVTLELLRPAKVPPAYNRQRYLTDILHVVIGGSLIIVGCAAVIAVLLDWIGVSGLGLQLPFWFQIVLLFLVSDLGFWIAHRLSHAVPALWRLHRIHHSSEHLDWLAAYRVHPLDQIFNSAIIALPGLVLGFSPAAIAVYAFVYQWHSIMLHSNVRVSFGPLNGIIASPRFHHWHHADDPSAYDRNFGGQLVIWDRMFGTANLGNPSLPARYGVDDPPPENFFTHLIAPFMERTANVRPYPAR